MNASRYYYTLRYLRPVQIWGRLRHRLYRPAPDLSPPPAVRTLPGIWRDPVKKSPSLITPDRFRFLNVEHDIASASDWNRPDRAKLWLYNLHYFDYLNASGDTDIVDRHPSLIIRWIAENPPVTGIGWEPYPVSIRIVNWIKWALAGNILPQKALESLAVQARFLAKRMEFHLLGNHLFANAKALVFAGTFFEGEEADALAVKGLRILKRELPEQILEDGGNFELSPMYHSIMLEDLLDLANLLNRHSGASFARITGAAERMIAWLKVMCHPDGQIALFNDAALGIASPPAELYEYSERLGIHEKDKAAGKHPQKEKSSIQCLSFGNISLTHLKRSGYIRVENGPLTAILDVAPIGPDYLPAHAHADTLSFELSFENTRVIVDSGTSLYEESEERLRQRGTAAHNTVAVDGKDSSEVWGSFRVARRARPYGLEIKKTCGGGVMVCCAHDGYRRLPGKPNHRREWHFEKKSFTVKDVIEGGYSEAVGYFHFHPSVSMDNNKDNNLFSITTTSGKKFLCRIGNGKGRLLPSTHHPEFGLKHENKCLEVQLNESGSLIIFEWS